MRLHKRMLALLLCCAFGVNASSCLSVHALDQFGYVLAVGMDQGERGGIMYTFLIQKNTEPDAQKSGGFSLTTVEADGFAEAVELATARSPFLMDFGRVCLFVISIQLLEREGMASALFSFSLAGYRIRDNASVFAALGSSYSALEGLKNEYDPSLSRLEGNFINLSKRTGMIPTANVALLTEGLSGAGYDAVLPLCGTKREDRNTSIPDSLSNTDGAGFGGSLAVNSDMATGLCGSALFAGGRVKGVLNGRDTQLMLMATGEFHQGSMEMLSPDGGTISVRFIENGTPKVSISLSQTATARVNIGLTAEIIYPDQLDCPAMEVESVLAAQLESAFCALTEGCQELGSDPFGYGARAAMLFPDQATWLAFDWYSVYRGMRVDYQVKITLGNNTQKSSLE